MNCIVNAITDVDQLGLKSSLLSPSNTKKSKSIFGGVVSLIMISLMISGVFYFFLEFIARKKFTMITNFGVDKGVSITMEKIPFLTRISDTGNVIFPDGYYYILMHMGILDENISQETKYIQIPIEPCNLETNLKHKKQLFNEESNVNTYFCPNWGNQTYDLYGIYGDKKYTFIRLQYHLCYNNKCPTGNIDKPYYTNKEIDDKLRASYIDYITVTNNIRHEWQNITSEVTYKRRLPSPINIFKRMTYFYDNIDYNTDIGYVFEDPELRKFSQVSETYESDIDLRLQGNTEFLRLRIMNYNIKTTYERSYTKAQTLLANIGGIINGLSICGTIFCYTISKNLYMLEMINSILDKNSYYIINENNSNNYEISKFFKHSNLELNTKLNRDKNKTMMQEVTNKESRAKIQIMDKKLILSDNSQSNNSRIMISGNVKYPNRESVDNYAHKKKLVRRKFELNWFKMIFPTSISLNKEEKFLYNDRQNKMNNILRTTSYLSIIQEYNAMKFLLLNKSQIDILENLFSPSRDVDIESSGFFSLFETDEKINNIVKSYISNL